MSPDEALALLRERGYGVQINQWAEDDDLAVTVWHSGKIVASADEYTLEEAMNVIIEVMR